MTRTRLLGLATVAVLCAIRDGYQYGLDIVEQSGHPSGTVYPTLGRMEKRGFVKGRWEAQRVADQEGRPRRRYYELTSYGVRALDEALAHYRRLSRLGSERPEPA